MKGFLVFVFLLLCLVIISHMDKQYNGTQHMNYQP